MGPTRATETPKAAREKPKGARTPEQQPATGAGGGKTKAAKPPQASEARRASGARRPKAGEGRDQSPKGQDRRGFRRAGREARGRGGPKGQPPNCGNTHTPTRNPDHSAGASLAPPQAQARRCPGRSKARRSAPRAPARAGHWRRPGAVRAGPGEREAIRGHRPKNSRGAAPGAKRRGRGGGGVGQPMNGPRAGPGQTHSGGGYGRNLDTSALACEGTQGAAEGRRAAGMGLAMPRA